LKCWAWPQIITKIAKTAQILGKISTKLSTKVVSEREKPKIFAQNQRAKIVVLKLIGLVNKLIGLVNKLIGVVGKLVDMVIKLVGLVHFHCFNFGKDISVIDSKNRTR
jgi:hypothetical protein